MRCYVRSFLSDSRGLTGKACWAWGWEGRTGGQRPGVIRGDCLGASETGICTAPRLVFFRSLGCFQVGWPYLGLSQVVEKIVWSVWEQIVHEELKNF